MIIGGGPVGVEMAGELAYKYDTKKITLVNGPDRLLAALPPGAGKKAEKVLLKKDRLKLMTISKS